MHRVIDPTAEGVKSLLPHMHDARGDAPIGRVGHEAISATLKTKAARLSFNHHPFQFLTGMFHGATILTYARRNYNRVNPSF